MTDLAIKLFAAIMLLSACHTDGSKKPTDNEVEGVRKVLGAPNDEEKYPDGTTLIYYFSSVCMANRIVQGADKSSIRVSFDLHKQYKKYDTRIE